MIEPLTAIFLDVAGKVSQLENQRDVLTVMRSEGT
jgi:hypothetical protein